MTVSRQTAETVTTLRTLIQREVGDTEGDRWSASEVDRALNFQLLWMGNEMHLRDAGEALLNTTLSYSGTSPNDLPSGVAAEHIVRVDDYTNSSNPIQLRFVSIQEMSDYNPSDTPAGVRQHYGYTLLGQTTNATTWRIQIVPIPQEALTLRIWYIATPYVVGVAADSVPLSPRWLEFAALGTAMRLLSRDDEATFQQQARHMKLEEQFRSFCLRQRGPQRIAKRRAGVS